MRHFVATCVRAQKAVGACEVSWRLVAPYLGPNLSALIGLVRQGLPGGVTLGAGLPRAPLLSATAPSSCARCRAAKDLAFDPTW